MPIYKTEKIEAALRIIANSDELKQQIGNNLDYLGTGSSSIFLETFGYSNWDEYNMSERKNIKQDYAVENYLQNHGRR